MDERLKLQWIDGQRPGANSPDAADPASPLTPADAPLVERAARADRAIQAALEDVPVPTGLADRLRARLAEGRTNPAQPVVPPPRELQADEATPAARPSRRRFLGTVAASVGLAAGGGWLLQQWLSQPGAPWGEEELLGKAFDQLETDLAREPRDLKDVDRETYPLPRSMLARGAHCVGWNQVTFLARSAVCFHLVQGNRSAALWVAPLDGERPLPAQLGYQRFAHSHSTGDEVGIAWQAQGMLYVAATKAHGGGIEQLKLFIAADEGSLA